MLSGTPASESDAVDSGICCLTITDIVKRSVFAIIKMLRSVIAIIPTVGQSLLQSKTS